MKFCGQCGTRLARACPNCGFANPPGFSFCGMCGTPLVQKLDLMEPLQPQPQAATRTIRPSVEAEDSTRSSPAPMASPAQLEGERRLATVILADVSNSTDLLEQLGSEAWVEIMNRVLQILESEVYRFGGEVDQFRGDGLVAFFGATSAHEDDPERAVLAALAMQQALRTYAAQLAQPADANIDRPIDLQLRVGVNTGEVIVVSIGDSRQHSEDTAMGEAIALAARMETAAEPGTVLVSENTYRLVESQFEWQPLGEITVKGISQPVAVYRPLAPLADAERLHRLRVHDLSIPLIGRDAEFKTLKRCVEDLYDGRGDIVLLTGERGMGKSFLVNQVRQHLVRQGALLAEAHDADASSPASLTWLHGRCRSYDQSWPYSMWLDLLRGWLGVRPGEPEEETRERLRRQTETLWGPHVAEDYVSLARFPPHLLKDTFPQRVDYLEGEEPHQQFFPAVRGWVEAMARRGPLILNFGDVHWADTTSLELLKYCLPLCDRYPLLWLIVFRPDRTSPVWEFQHYVETEYPHRLTRVTLPPLTETQSAEFIDQLIGADVLPEETRDLVISKAEGTPYYIGELLRSLIAQRVLVQDSETGKWHATRPVASLDLPDSLQSVLLARIDRLSPEERHVLQMAAVIGRMFWSDVLRALAGDGAPLGAAELQGCLTALQRAQLITEGGRVPHLGREYVFVSNLIRDAAYESLLSTQRVAYHRQVAQHLEELLHEEALAQHYGLLAYHYRCAGDHAKELHYTIQAAKQAQGMYANAEALERYTRALKLLDRLEAKAADEERMRALRTQRFEVLNERREIFFLTGDFQAGITDAEALLPLARQLADDPRWLIDALLQQPGVASWETREELQAGTPMAEEALSLAQQLGDRHREMRCLASIAGQRYGLSDPTWQEYVDRALALARELGDKRFEVGLLTGVGGVYANSQPELSMQYLEAAIPISEELNDKRAELEVLNLIGQQLEGSDDYYWRLTECHEKQLHISREIGHRPAEARALMFCGQIKGLYLGDYEAGIALLEKSLRIWEGMPGELYPLLRIIQIQVMQGRLEEAQVNLERARAIGEHHTQDMGLVGLDLVSAILYNSLGDEANLRMALSLATRTREAFVDSPELSRQYQMAAACEVTAAHLGLAQTVPDTAERQTHLRQALESSQVALDLYQASGFVRPIECVSEEILYRHSLALAANGRGSVAAEYLRRAHKEMIRKHDLIPPDSHFHRTYLQNIPLHQDIQAA